LFTLNRLKKAFEIAFPKSIIPFALDEFKNDRANHGFGKRKAERIRSA